MNGQLQLSSSVALLLLLVCSCVCVTSGALVRTSTLARQISTTESYKQQALKNVPIAEQIREKKRQDAEEVMNDPLYDIMFTGGAPEDDKYVKMAKDMLTGMVTGTDRTVGTRWLDEGDLLRDRDTLAAMVSYCARLFVHKGVHKDCIVQCHPKVDCGSQAARNCKPWKDKYDNYMACMSKELGFCHKHGKFYDRKIPAFEPKGLTQIDKVDSVVEYCGNLFQWRGVRLPCLRTCSLWQMKQTDPDSYFFWKAKMRRKWNAENDIDQKIDDPTENATEGQRATARCEKDAMNLCQHVKKDYYSYCYEHTKFRCMSRAGEWNSLMPN